MEDLHSKLVEASYKWVLKNGCGVAFKELYTNACNGESPDVIGFSSWGRSVLIECKASRSDFLSDRKKSFRKNPELGMGSHRYYCCPANLITVSDLPLNWGLLYMNDRGKISVAHKVLVPHPEYPAHKRPFEHEKNLKAEHGLMYSALRRLHLRGLINEIYTKPSQEAIKEHGIHAYRLMLK